MKQRSDISIPAARFWLFAITAMALVIRFATLGAQALWTDEAITLELATGSWSRMLEWLLYDVSPPLFYLLVRAWDWMLPDGTTTRLISVIAGAATVPATYLLGSKLFNRRVGLFAAFLLAANPYHFYYSQELRYPAVLTLAVVLQMWAFLQLLEEKDWTSASLFSLLTVIAVWIQYLAAFVVIAEAAYLAVRFRAIRPAAWRGVIALGISGLAILPMMPLLLKQFERKIPTRIFLSLSDTLHQAVLFPVLGGSEFSLPALYLFGGIAPDPGGTTYLKLAWLLAAPFVVFGIWGLRLDRKRERTPFVTSVLLLLPAVLFITASRFVPIFRPKYLLFLVPVGLCLVAAGALGKRDRGKPWLAWSAILVLGTIAVAGLINQHSDPLCKREPWREVSDSIARFGRPGDAILVPNRLHSMALERSYSGGLPVLSYVSETPTEQIAKPIPVENKAVRWERTYRRFWLVRHKTDIFDPAGVMERIAEERWTPLQRFEHPEFPADIPVILYGRKSKDAS
jgi:uncharacterized membrane protein